MVLKIANVKIGNNISEEHNMHKTFSKIEIFSWALKTFQLKFIVTDGKKKAYFLDLNVITNVLIFNNCFALSNRL